MAMKNLLTIFVLTAMTFSFPAAAGTANCSTIRDHDSRMMCNAVATGSSSWCSFIKDHDNRVKCFVSVGK